MAEFLYVCVLFCILLVEGTQRYISGLYCRDPDTGKLYEVNSTWPSETFCGNYTCKLSKKNVTETEYTPIIKINITDVKLPDGDNQNETKTFPYVEDNITKTESSSSKKIASPNALDMEISPSEVSETIKKVSSIIKPIALKETTRIKTNDTDTKNNDENDRYLTESEIQVITNILHTVRKSDLEAIVDVYNLAQEIYNEMESTTEKTKLSSSQINSYININKILDKDTNEVSYWHDHLKDPKDMKTETTSPISTIYSYPATYFRGSFTKKDFRQLPYYYPMSDFQRMSSYVYTKPKSNANKCEPRSKERSNTLTTSAYTTSIKPTTANIDEKSSPSLLPYSFSNVRHRNVSDYASYYYNYYPWAQLDMYNKNRYYVPNYLSSYFPQTSNTISENYKPTIMKPQSPNVTAKKSKKTNIQSQAPNTILEKSKQKSMKQVKQKNKNTEKESTVKNTETKKETKKMPKWQTEPLSQQVIDEVRANVMDEPNFLNLFPRLERVGKVIKLDELLRSKRQVDNGPENLDYGVQLGKIECETGTELGFFSYGNLTAPYPECCPRKLMADKK